MQKTTEIAIEKLMSAKKRLSVDRLSFFGAFFSTQFIKIYCTVLVEQSCSDFLKKRSTPQFEEEIIVSSKKIWEKHSHFIHEIIKKDDTTINRFSDNFLNDTSFDEFLVIIGQRFTPASEKTCLALPPTDEILNIAAMQFYNTDIKIAVRAWEKHVGRSSAEFWGEIKGSPVAREQHVKEVMNRIFEDASWRNTFTHYKHGLVYEIRSSCGHGLRWQLNPIRFIGFVEPFLMEDKEKYPFSMEEWETCLSVLEKLKNVPMDNPNNEHFKSLINKIKKNARKTVRAVSYTAKKQMDTEIRKDATLVKNALQGKTNYTTNTKEANEYKKLNIPINCYCCNSSFTDAHFFYNRICPTCAEENYEKRFQAIDLTGKTAVLTGCRVKIGYATALKLLRSGVQLIGTSRFPAIALEQFKKEEDFDNWKNKLFIYGLDLRSLKQIELFTKYVFTQFKQLDILINNAAQTIKYPTTYYQPLIQNENKLLGIEQPNSLHPNAIEISNDLKLLDTKNEKSISKNTKSIQEYTRFGQPVDVRDKTSWNSKLTEVDLEELLEVNLINQIAPYYLIKELKPLMLNQQNGMSHIINVTSSEGIFSYGNKTSYHPHTNMTKASLNMLTRTSATDFAKDSILMNCVDVGWVSTGAMEKLRKKQFEKMYIPPLDSVDGAARIMDPIIEAINGNSIFGKLLKNYKEHDW